MSKLVIIYDQMRCFRCKQKKDNKDLSFCGGCKQDPNCTQPACYCNESCQKAHWKEHKKACPLKKGPCSPTASWVDHYRQGSDESLHSGDLELITWDHKDCGWGGCSKYESDELKKKYEEEFHYDKEKLFIYFDSAFRWTCCGLDAGAGVHGCDHHGDLKSKPCKCDFCKAGIPIPDKLFNKKTQHKKGLTLRQGPDPRSATSAGQLNWRMRQAFYGGGGINAGIDDSSDDND